MVRELVPPLNLYMFCSIIIFVRALFFVFFVFLVLAFFSSFFSVCCFCLLHFLGMGWDGGGVR